GIAACRFAPLPFVVGVKQSQRTNTKGATEMTTAQEYLDRRWTALILLCVAQFVVVLDASIVNVALPSIGKGLHFSEADLPWVVNAYVIAFGGFLLLGGRAADLLGRRRVFMAGLLVVAVASLFEIGRASCRERGGGW